jgi:hypothetical protein
MTIDPFDDGGDLSARLLDRLDKVGMPKEPYDAASRQSGQRWRPEANRSWISGAGVNVRWLISP